METNEMPVWARALIEQLSNHHHQLVDQQAQQNERFLRIEEQLFRQGTPAISDRTTPNLPEGATTTPLPDSPQSEPVRRPRSRLPDPPTFKGSRTDWPVFQMAIENKLLVDSEALGDDRACLLYVYSRLEGNASKNTVAFMQHRRQNGKAQDLIQYLENIYGDPNLKRRATQRLREMKQGTKQSFAKFFPMFEKEFADSGAMTWPEDAKISILTGSLNLSMRSALSYRESPENFADLILLLRRIDTDLDLLSAETNRRPNRYERQLDRPRSPVADQMDWTPARVSKAQTARNSQTKRARWVDKDEMDRRREEGLCFRCGRKDCYVAACPYQPAQRPDTRSTAKVRTAKIDHDKKKKGNKTTARTGRTYDATTSEDSALSDEDVDTTNDSGNE